jgi:hypothetical protein
METTAPPPPSDFAATVDTVLRASPNVADDGAALSQLLRMMARKVQLQEYHIAQQGDAILALSAELLAVKDAARAAAAERDAAVVPVDDVAHAQLLEHRAMLLRLDGDVDALKAQADAPRSPPRIQHDERPAVTVTTTPARGTAAPHAGASTQRTATPERAVQHMIARDAENVVTFSPSFSPAMTPIGAPPPQKVRDGAAVDPTAPRPLAGIELIDTPQGPRVSAMKPGGPAQSAGLEIGDHVLRLNGHDVRQKSDFVNSLARCVAGQCVDVAYRRNHRAVSSVKVYLGAAAMPRS